MTKTISVPKKDITKIFPTISGIQIKKTAFDSQTSQTTAKNDNSTIANMGNDKYMIS